MNDVIINSLTLIANTYQSIVAYFYQRVVQTAFVNNDLATYIIDFSLLLPSSKFIFNLNINQINAQMQAYINLCNDLIFYITTSTQIQTNLTYEQIQNILNSGITQLNGFALSLLEANSTSTFKYNIPYDMGLTTAIFLNNLDMNTYFTQINLNNNIVDFNNILQNTQLNLLRS